VVAHAGSPRNGSLRNETIVRAALELVQSATAVTGTWAGSTSFPAAVTPRLGCRVDRPARARRAALGDQWKLAAEAAALLDCHPTSS